VAQDDNALESVSRGLPGKLERAEGLFGMRDDRPARNQLACGTSLHPVEGGFEFLIRPLSNARGGVVLTSAVTGVGRGAPVRHHFFTRAAFPDYLCSSSARRLSAVPSVTDLGKRFSHSAQNSGLSRLFQYQAR
jgi:hypothetical protein